MTVETQLHELEQTQLVRRLAEPDLAYAFKHILVQEVVYESLLRQDRKQLHRTVGRALESLFADRREEIAPLLAHHFDEGDEPAKALRYFRMAGESAASHFSHDEAIAHFEGARSVSQGADPDVDAVIDVYQRLGRERELAGQYVEAVALYEELLERGRREAQPRFELSALLSMTTLQATPTPYFDLAKAEVSTTRALDLAHSLEDRAAETKALWQRMLALSFGNNAEEGIRVGEHAIALARELNLKEQLAFALNDISGLYAGVGAIDRALQAAEEARELWTELGNLPMLTDILSNSTMLLAAMGDTEGAIAVADEAYAISLRIGNLWGRSFSRMFVGVIHLERGEIDRGLEIMQESITYGEKVGFMAPQVFVRGWLAVVLAVLGDVEAGVRQAKLAGERAAKSMPSWSWAPNVFQAEILSRVGRVQEAEDLLEPEQLLAEDRNPTWSLVFFPIPLTRARVQLAAGRLDEAIQTCHDLETLLDQSHMVTFQPEVLHLLGEALRQRGDLPAAAEAWRRGLGNAQKRSNRLTGWQIRLDLAELETVPAEERAQFLATARADVQFIADHIADDRLRNSFLSLPRVQKALARA